MKRNMNHNFVEQYKIEIDPIKESYQKQLGLKENVEYEAWADEAAIGIIEYFLTQYKGAKIEIPKLREKSPKSLLGKIKNLQIERLSKLYAIEGISVQDKQCLFSLIQERIYENEELDSTSILDAVKQLLYHDIEEIPIEDFEKKVMVEGISNSTKTALLRILVSKIEKSNLSDKEEKLQVLDEKYGDKAQEKTGLIEKNIIRYDSIRKIRNNEVAMARLRNEKVFLKANDLRGMKIIVVDLPDDFATENEKIKQILQMRKQEEDTQKKILYTHCAIAELGKEFYRELANNQELLQRLHMKVIPDSSKHKKKSNGYEAEHIKFVNSSNPEYTLELQYKSEYVENICKGEGIASHENRPGKKRILPHVNSREELIKQLSFMVPGYKTFKKDKMGIKVEKYNLLQSTMAYFQYHMVPQSEEYEEIIKALSTEQENEEQKAI